jgi:hypothetical protein
MDDRRRQGGHEAAPELLYREHEYPVKIDVLEPGRGDVPECFDRRPAPIRCPPLMGSSRFPCNNIR